MESTLRAAIEALQSHGDVRGSDGAAIDEVMAQLDVGALRVCEPVPGGWQTNAWVKTAILLYFKRYDSHPMGEPGGIAYFDKVPTKTNYGALGARCVPPGVARYGSFLGRGAILMPGYVNVGAYVDENTMVDTWATVGSCAQVGRDCHLSGGVGLGGVLEPPSARPVVIEDGAFIGSRVVIVEGVHVGREAVIGAGVVLTSSTTIIDVTESEPREWKGHVPARSVVIPGMREKQFKAGKYGVPCALIIGRRSESTDKKVSLNDALRDFAVPV